MLSKRKFRLAGLALLLSASLGCDETQITAPETGTQAIVGRVVSAETGIAVSAWQATLVRSTVADDAGYFTLDSMPIGIYEVRVATPSGRTLSIEGVTVQAQQTTSLKDIRLTAPTWPLSAVYPRDSAVGIAPRSPNIQIISTQPLDLVSLSASVTFTPGLQGTWRASTYGPSPVSSILYQFTPTTPLEVATQYTWKIGPSLTLAGGQGWGDSLTSVFWTDSLRIMHYGPRPSPSAGTDEIAPARQFDLYIAFNAFVDPDSLTSAVSFTPPLEGVWVEDPYYARDAALKFFYTGDAGLRAEQTYVMQVDGSVPLVGASTLAHDVDLPFTTTSVQVIQSYPRQGSNDQQCTGCSVQLTFNSEMDSASLHSAFTLETLQGDTIAGSIQVWNDQFVFAPDSALVPGAVYVAYLTTEAHSQWGDHLKEPYTLYFRVRS